MSMFQQLPLGEISEFVLDGTHGSPERTESGVPVLSASNVIAGNLDLHTDRYTSQREYEQFRRRLNIQSGDVLLTIVGSIGRAAVIDEPVPLVFQRSVAIIRPKTGMLSSRYLYYALSRPETTSHLSRLTNKSAQAGVYLGKLKTLLIPLAPLPEQRRIAAILDKANVIRRKQQQVIERMEDFLRSVFLDMFGDPMTNPKGWKVARLITVATKFSDGPFGSNLKTAHYVDRGVRVIRLQNIGIGKFLDEDKAFVSEQHFSSLKKHECIPGDVLIGTLGDPNLRACILPKHIDFALNKADCIQLRSNLNYQG